MQRSRSQTSPVSRVHRAATTGHRRRRILERRNVAVEDRLAPARGILVAIIAGAFVWVMIVLSVWMLVR
ncbi:MAG: hypothetical protein ACXVQT_03120 [Actinomycetota bacterium]